MVVEPMAGDRVEDNLNTVGRAYYGFSTLLCTPASLSQDVGLALGTQAGPAKIRDVSTAAGFTAFRTAATHPVQQRVRGPPVTRDPLQADTARVSAHPSRSADPDVTGVAVRDGVELAYEVFHQDHPHDGGPGARPGRSCPRGSGRRRSASWPGTTG